MVQLQSAVSTIDPFPTSLWSLGIDPVTMPQNATLADIAVTLGHGAVENSGCVLVVQDEKLVGLVTDRDLIRLLANGVPLETSIDQKMTDSLTTLSVEESLSPLDVVDLMRQRQIHHLPLVDDQQRPVRLITAHSLQQQLELPHVLKLQTVRSRMITHLATANPTDSAFTAALLLAQYQVDCVAVIDASEGLSALVGLVLRQDLLRFQARQLDLNELSVQAVMREASFCLSPTDSLWLAYQEMGQRHLPCLPVITPQRQPLGIITQADLLYSLDVRELQTSFSHVWQSFKQSGQEQLDLWKSHSSELERLIQGRTEQLEEQAKCDRLLTTLTQRIHESLNVQDILQTTVSEVRQLLQVDRALIYRFETAAVGTITVEAVIPPWPSLLGHQIQDECFARHWAEAYRYGRIQAVEDIRRAGLRPCHIDMLAEFQIKANLVVPIVYDHRLWGLLVLNQCERPRRWRDWEIRLIEQLARSVAIAIRQSELYRQLQADLEMQKDYEAHLQQLNNELEQKVEDRTASWRQVTAQLQAEVDHRRQAERALAQTNQQLQAVLDAVPAMVSWVSAEGRYLGCNRRLADAFDLTPADFVGQPIGFSGQASPFSEFVHRVLTGTDDTASEEIQFALNGPEGYWWLVAQKYSQGTAAVIVGLDISDLQQTKMALQQSETKFRSLVEQTSDWVWESDDQMRFIYSNPRATEMLEYAPETILQNHFTDFMAEDEAVRFSTVLAHVVQPQQPFTQIEATCLKSGGEPITLEISGSPIFSQEGDFQGYRGITRDITERKQVERDIRKALTREKELNDLKTRFISMASHEFRTPLTTILASAETLERYRNKLSPEKQEVVLQRIQTSVHHVIGLLNDVLTVGKTEAHKLTCIPAPLDLQQFCQDLIEELQFAQANPAQVIQLEFTGKTSPVLADSKLLRHILSNLLSNAVKYSPDHSPIKLTVNCTPALTTFHVKDQGIGIPPEDQPKLFESFNRATNVGNISGTGLGLVIAKRAAEAHQGCISFQSALGEGTTFTVELPLMAIATLDRTLDQA